MTSITDDIDNQQKELCAVAVMRSMLEDYCMEQKVSFDDAFFKFVSSGAYSMLFDYSTGLWMEGQDYLRETFERCAEFGSHRKET